MPRSTIQRPSKTRTLLIAAAWLLIWQLCHLAIGEELLLPSPPAVLQRLALLLAEPDFYHIVAGSFVRICGGFLLGLGLGCLIGCLTAFSPTAYAFFAVPMHIIQATPVASFVILALVWISGRNLSVFIAFLMVLPPIWQNVHTGLTQTDPQLLEMARVYRLSRAKTLRYIYLPAVLPYLLSAVRVGLGFSWKAGIAGEVIAIPSKAIGTQLYNAKVYLDTPGLFAWTAVIVLLSVLIERGMLLLFPQKQREVRHDRTA